MQFMTRQVFDTLIIGTIIVGGALAAVRLYRDLTRPLPGRSMRPRWADEDTQPGPPVEADQGETNDEGR